MNGKIGQCCGADQPFCIGKNNAPDCFSICDFMLPPPHDGSIILDRSTDEFFLDGLMRILDILLFGALLCLAVFLIRLDIEDARQLRDLSSASLSPFERPEAFQFLGAHDEKGTFISAPPVRFRKLVFFVLHGRRFQTDVDFWNAALADKANPGDVGFAGVCDGPECSARVLSVGSEIHFLLIDSAEYAAMKALLRADARGQVLVMGLPAGKMYKAAYPKSPRNLAELRLGAAQ